MASACSWMLVASLAFLLIVQAAEAQNLSQAEVPAISDTTNPRASENQEEETTKVSVPGQRSEENDDSTDLSNLMPDYQQELVVLGHW